jgi:hypothetical protein
VADRDIEIGRLQATAESLRNQSADQFKRIDTLEVDVATLKANHAALDERLDALGAPTATDRRNKPSTGPAHTSHSPCLSPFRTGAPN